LPAASSGLPARLGRAVLERRAQNASREASLLDLAPGGVYLAAHVTVGAGGLLHHPFTLTFRERKAVFSLWHYPAGRPGSVLPTTLPCGARTFLGGSPKGSNAVARPTRLLGSLPILPLVLDRTTQPDTK